MPPPAIRRPLTITTWLVLSIVCLAASPLLLLVAAVAAAFLRRPQPLLLARFVIAYFARELAVLTACGALWLASGFGVRMRTPRFQVLHCGLLRWFVHGIAERILSLLNITVASDVHPEAAGALAADEPLLFFSRHAGPADTVLLIDLLLTRYDRVPSVVFKQTLTIDPCVDLIGHRLPHAVLDTSKGEECEERIAQVSGGLDRRGVLVLFPEGGNFTPERRRRAIRSLRRKEQFAQAAAAEQMTHVMPPHPGGALAAFRGNPAADVIFSTHTGLGLAAFPRELWRNPPIGRTLTARMWLAPADERPSDPDEQVAWLYGWWRRLDQWVERQGEEVQSPGAVRKVSAN